VNPFLKAPADPIDPIEFAATYPGLAAAIENAKIRIRKRAAFEVDQTIANLKIVLDDFCSQNKITQIAWAGAADLVSPQFPLDVLGARLVERLAEIRFAEFLERFADELIELDQAEKRSQ
jgi:hypothetical protein